MNDQNQKPQIQVSPNERQGKLNKSLSVGTVFLYIYGLMALAFIGYFVLMASNAHTSDENLGVWSTLIQGFFIVPAAYAVVFVIHLTVLALEKARKKPDEPLTLPTSPSLSSQVGRGLLIAFIVGFVGLMAFFGIWLTVR